MRLPKPRNLALGILVVAVVLVAGLLIAQDQETLRVRVPLAATDAGFPAYLATLLGHPLTAGDAYQVHRNGDAAFPAMLAAIDGAKHRVSFESYIFGTGQVAERFTTALERAAGRGVEVKIVLDSMGASDMEESHLARLEKAGCRVGWFNPVGHFEEVNYRTHRKALVVDGDVAFVGGMGIADQWAMAAEGAPKWRDTHVELHGPAAIQVEAAFNENWIETGGVVDPDILTHTPPTGPARSIVIWSSPEGGANELKLLYLLAIGSARQTLDIQSPYLITDESTTWSIAEARKRGVRIRMLTEGDITDAKPVKFASRSTYDGLMTIGVDIYEYQPSMMHVKALVVDGVLSIVGSANFDNRSLELNDELSIAVFDPKIGAALTGDFERDLGQSMRLNLQDWRARPPHIKAREQVWGFFGEVF